MNNKIQSSAAFMGWQTVVARYQQPDLVKSMWQVVNSFRGFLLCWLLVYVSLRVGYWLTLLLGRPTAGFLVRIFIIQHDCGHGSFFKARRANDIKGIISGILTMVPYRYWRKSHATHHAHHAELEERGIGDIWTMTVVYPGRHAGQFLYEVAPLLQWFTGNIGFHHIHHLSPRIPNYNLEDCHKENPIFQRVTELTLVSGWKTMSLTLWDEERQRLITFREAAQRYLTLSNVLALQPEQIRQTEAI